MSNAIRKPVLKNLFQKSKRSSIYVFCHVLYVLCHVYMCSVMYICVLSCIICILSSIYVFCHVLYVLCHVYMCSVIYICVLSCIVCVLSCIYMCYVMYICVLSCIVCVLACIYVFGYRLCLCFYDWMKEFWTMWYIFVFHLIISQT